MIFACFSRLTRTILWVCGQIKNLHNLYGGICALMHSGAALVGILKACAKNKDLKAGANVHADIIKQELLGKNPFVASTLVSMYARCGALAKAQEALEELPVRDVVSWNALIAGFADKECGKTALNCYKLMQCEGLLPNAVTFVCLLKACGSMKAVNKGKQLHFKIISQGLLSGNMVLGNALIDMYCKCDALAIAKFVLEGLPIRDVVSWSSLITGYVQGGHVVEALDCFEQMQHEGLSADAITFMCIIKALGGIGALKEGICIHSEIVRQGLIVGNGVLGSYLVDMYVKCGALEKAKELLEELSVRNVVSWNALIAGYVEGALGKEALDCFQQMQCEGFVPDEVTYICALKACGSLGALRKGSSIHFEIARQGLLDAHVVLGGALVDMYARCGALTTADTVLQGIPVRNVISWNALVAGYAQEECGKEALHCFEQMQLDGCMPDAVTFACILNACGSIGALDTGEMIHAEIVKQDLLNGNVVLGNALVDMYIKCGVCAKARELLEGLTGRNVISWSALIAGYLQEEHAKEALNCYERMQREGLVPDAFTLVCILKACGTTAALEKGEDIHMEIVRLKLLSKNVILGSALVDMYAKCSAFAKAEEVLEELPVRDVVSWSTLIAGYAQQEEGKEALCCFERMQSEGLHPDGITFLCVLSACSHSGLLNEGRQYFATMIGDYSILPDPKHHSCVIDLFARVGHLDKAADFIQKMPTFGDVRVWVVLLSACKKWGNSNLGRWAFEQAVQSDNIDMSHVCVAADKKEQAE